MGENLQVEIIAYAPTAYYHCQHCEIAAQLAGPENGVANKVHQEQVNSSLPPDLARDYQLLSDWVRKVLDQYGDRVVVKVVDAASIEGLVKSLRYRLHHFPAVIINRKITFSKKTSSSGNPFEDASEEMARLLEKV